MRGLEMRVAVVSGVAPSLIIGHAEDDVGLLGEEGREGESEGERGR